MREDEYDALLADPEGFFRRALLPRFGSAFAPLAALPPFTDFMEAAAMPYNMLGFGSPGAGRKGCSGWSKSPVSASPG